MAKTLELSKDKPYPYKSRYGSHSSMINEEATAKLPLEANDVVVLTDEFGDYTTERSNLDSGTVDQRRCATSRLGKLFEKSADRKGN